MRCGESGVTLVLQSILGTMPVVATRLAAQAPGMPSQTSGGGAWPAKMLAFSSLDAWCEAGSYDGPSQLPGPQRPLGFIAKTTERSKRAISAARDLSKAMAAELSDNLRTSLLIAEAN